MRRIGVRPRGISVLILAILLLALSPTPSSGKSLAAPTPQVQAELPRLPDDLPYCDAPLGGCNQIQVVVLIDESNSMQRYDPARLRIQGATYLVDLLGKKYLDALAAQAPLPTIQLAVIHFGSGVSQAHSPGWITIAPDSRAAWAEQLAQLKEGVIGPEALIRGGLAASHFIDPFWTAKELFAGAGPQEKGCPQRVMLLFTDGAPADARVLTGAALQAHMEQVQAIVQASLAGDGYFLYLTMLNAAGDQYGQEARPYWEQISAISSAAPLAGLPRLEQASSYVTVDLRMDKIAAANLGALTYPLGVEPANLPDHLRSILTLTASVEPAADAPQQLTAGDLQLSLLDTSGRPVTRVDDAGYSLAVSAEVFQEGQSGKPLALSEDGAMFKAAFLPVSAQPAQVSLQAALLDARQEPVCRLHVEPARFDIPVAPLQCQVEALPGPACADSQGPVSYALTLVNGDTGLPADPGEPVNWALNSSTAAGQPVRASVQPLDAGQYQLNLYPDQAEDITTNLYASVQVAGQVFPLCSQTLTTTGLLEDRSLAFAFEAPQTPADRLSLFFNRLFNPAVRKYTGQVLIGRRLFGWLGQQDVKISGRFINLKTETDEAGIERFSIQLAPADGGAPLEKSNAWTPGQAGAYQLRVPAPRLGAYQVNAIDEGEPATCTVVGGVSTENILLVNDFGEYLAWILLLLLALLLLAWLIWLLVARYLNRPWGRLELVNPQQQVVWIGDFESRGGKDEREQALISPYTWRQGAYLWKLDPERFFGIVKIRARTWDQPRNWVRIEVRRVKDGSVFRGYLHPRCSYIHWDSDGVWKDPDLENNFRLTWRNGS